MPLAGNDRLNQRLSAILLMCLLAGIPLGAQGLSPWQRAEQLRQAKRLDEALRLIREGVKSRSSTNERVESARVEQMILHDLGRYGEAQEAGERWIAAARQAGDGKALPQAHYQTARSFIGQRKLDEAAAHLSSAVDQLRQTRDPGLENAVLIDLANVEANRSRYPSALALLDRAASGLKQQPDLVLEARMWMIRATVARYRDEDYESVSLMERAHEKARQTDNKGLQATILTNWGQAQMGLHRYADALALYQRAVALDAAPDLPGRAVTLISIGICHYEINQLEEAARAFEQAREIASKLKNRAVEAWALGELGLTAWKARDNRKAVEYLDQSVVLFQKAGDRRNALTFLENKAGVSRDEGRFADALAGFRSVERMISEIPGQKPSANLYKGIGQALAGLGDADEAAEMFRRSIREANSSGDIKRVWQSSVELARLYGGQGRIQDAGRAYEDALAAIESQRRSLRLDAFKTDFFEDKVQVYEEYAGFILGLEEDPRVAERSFEVAERARARSFLDSLEESRAAIHETLPADVVNAQNAIFSEISELQAEIRRGESGAQPKSNLAAKEKELEDLYVRVRSEHPRFRDMRYPEPARLSAVQAALRSGEMLVDFMVGDKKSFAWLITKDDIRWAQLPARAVLEASIREGLAQLVTPTSNPKLDAAAGHLIGALGLSETLPRSLIIVPSGILYYFPFEILPFGPNRQPIAATSTVSYLPSASSLVQMRTAPRRDAAARRLLAVGDAEYPRNSPASVERTAGDAAMGARNLGPLPYSRNEVFAIRSLFGRLSTTVLLDRNATEGNLKRQDLARYSVIHLAAHGWIDSSSPSGSGIVFGLDRNSAEDGLLQVREILRMPLTASLVTLSACQSGLGKLITGEGMAGLTRAFFYAGAESVVATLWNVNDEASTEFMSAFYEFLKRGESKAEALRLAKLRMAENPKYSHPYYWGAYILAGEGSDPVAFPSSAWVVWPTVAFLLALAAFSLKLYRRGAAGSKRL